jgi:hypothetical protein
MSLLASCVQSNSTGYYFPLVSASSLGATASSGVTQIVAGAGISVTPSSGVGAVTITNIGVVSLTASTGITNSGTATAPILAASVPTGSNITTYYADAVVAYSTGSGICPPNTSVPLATITLPVAANYAQAIWAANPLNVGSLPEIVSVGVDATAAVYIYLSASSGAFAPATSYGAFQCFPGNGTGEPTTKLPSTAAGTPPPAVMSAKAPSAQTLYYMMLQNGNNASNVYINASTSTSQTIQVVAQVVST